MIRTNLFDQLNRRPAGMPRWAAWLAMAASFAVGITLFLVAASLALILIPCLLYTSRLPVAAVIVAAFAAFALPSLVASPILDQPWAVWLGFSRLPLQTCLLYTSRCV